MPKDKTATKPDDKPQASSPEPQAAGPVRRYRLTRDWVKENGGVHRKGDLIDCTEAEIKARQIPAEPVPGV